MMPEKKPKTIMEAANKGAYNSPSHGGMSNMKDPSYNSGHDYGKKMKKSKMNY